MTEGDPLTLTVHDDVPREGARVVDEGLGAADAGRRPRARATA